MDMSDQLGLPSIAEMFAAVAVPKVTEGSRLFGKKYVRMGPLFSAVGGWMFQSGGTLGYGLKEHPLILGKLLGIPADRANDYVQKVLQKIATNQLAQVKGENKTLIDLFLYPSLAEQGYELTPDAEWINIRVNNEESIYSFTQIAFQRGVAVSFHFPKDFKIYWANTFKPRPQKEWDEMYRLGIVTTPQQDILILEDEVSSALAGAVDWVREIAPNQLTSNEISILKKLVSP